LAYKRIGALAVLKSGTIWMDFRLKIFHTVAQVKSFTKAAEILNLTQPAITFQIKNLEEEFCTRLFNRDQNRINLTETGRILFRHAERILDEYEKASDEIARITGVLSGEIRIGVASLLGKYLLPKLIGIFKQTHPNINIIMLVGDSAALIQKIQEHTVDLVIVSEPFSLKNFVMKPLIDDEIVVIVHPAHKWACRDHIEIEDFHKEPFIAREYGSGLREVFKNFLGSKNISLKNLKIVMTLGSSEALKSAVESGVGYTIISNMAVKREIELGSLKQVPVKGMNLKRRFFIVYSPQHCKKNVIGAFLNFMYSNIPQ
jgi:DNA-binding transcriptional LysR family regulator